MFKTISAVFTCLLATSAHADLSIEFIEGAPKDRFVIRNMATCALENAELEINFAGSKGGLIFDVTGQGAGVEVFQPFEVTKGAETLGGMPSVLDGDQAVQLSLASLGAQQTVSFTVDVDDTINAREITVTDSEFSGAQALLTQNGAIVSETFGAEPSLRIDTTAC